MVRNHGLVLVRTVPDGSKIRVETYKDASPDNEAHRISCVRAFRASFPIGTTFLMSLKDGFDFADTTKASRQHFYSGTKPFCIVPPAALDEVKRGYHAAKIAGVLLEDTDMSGWSWSVLKDDLDKVRARGEGWCIASGRDLEGGTATAIDPTETPEAAGSPAPSVASALPKFKQLVRDYPMPVDTTGRPLHYVPKEIWGLLIRNILEGKHTLLTGPPGTGKTTLIALVAQVMGKRFESFSMGDNLNPMSKLIGKTWYEPSKGTWFKESRFVNALKDAGGCVINLDDLSRAHPDVTNVLFPVLDGQRYLPMDESEDAAKIPVAEGCVFMGSANEGREYTGTMPIDRAFKSRWHSVIEVDYLPKEEEAQLLMQRTGIDAAMATKLAEFAKVVREMWKSEEVSTGVDTRQMLVTASNILDGMTMARALEFTVTPFFDPSGGASSERAKVKQVVQRF